MVKLGFLWVESILQRQQTKDNRRYDNTSSWDIEGEGLLPWHFSSCRKIGGSLRSRKKMWVTAIPRWTQTTIVNNNKADSLCQYKDEFLSRLSIALFCPQFLKCFFFLRHLQMCGRLLSLVRVRVTAFVAMLSVANDTRTGRANPASKEDSGKECAIFLSLLFVTDQNFSRECIQSS